MPAEPTIAEYAFYCFITGCAVAVLLLAAWYIGRRCFIRHEKLKIIKAELDAKETTAKRIDWKQGDGSGDKFPDEFKELCQKIVDAVAEMCGDDMEEADELWGLLQVMATFSHEEAQNDLKCDVYTDAERSLCDLYQPYEGMFEKTGWGYMNTPLEFLVNELHTQKGWPPSEWAAG